MAFFKYSNLVILIPNAVVAFCFTTHDCQQSQSVKYTKHKDDEATTFNIVRVNAVRDDPPCPLYSDAGMTRHLAGTKH